MTFLCFSLFLNPSAYEFLQFLVWILSMNLAHFWNPTGHSHYPLSGESMSNWEVAGGRWYILRQWHSSLPRSSLDFQKNDTSHEPWPCLSFAHRKASWLATTDAKAFVMEAPEEAWKWKMTSCWSSCSVAYYRFKLLSFSLPEPKYWGCQLPRLQGQRLGQRCPKKYVSHTCIWDFCISNIWGGKSEINF